MAEPGRPGRRPGRSGTREAIEGAARRQFAQVGYDRTSLRSVAREAGVDPALVVHFFGTKQQLFAEVAAIPYDPAEAIPRVLAGDPADVGRRLATFVVGLLESDARAAMVGLVRAAATEPAAAEVVRDLVSGRVLQVFVDTMGVDDAALRASLVGSQIVGLTMARYVVGVPPLAAADVDTLIDALAPTFQRLLTEPLSG